MHSANDSGPPGVNQPIGSALAIAFAVLAAGYFVWFAAQTPRRIELLRLVQDPFTLIAEWFGPAGTPLGLADRVPVLALAALVLLAAYGLGRLFIDRLRLAGGCNELERVVFALAAGLSGLSTIVLLIGLAGTLRQAWLLWLLTGGLASVGAWQIYLSARHRNATEGVPYRNSHSAFRIPHSALAWLALPFVLILLLGACLPPWDFDVREYHLQVPKEWLQQGRITFLPHNVYGNLPLGAEMHALLAMALWPIDNGPGDDGPGEHGWFYGALAGKLVIASLALVTTLGVAAAGFRVADKSGAILAALVFLSHPWVIHVSVSGLNDGVLACYVFLAFYSMWLARHGSCSFLLPGLFAGAAAAVKYPGLVFAVAPLAAWAALPVGRISNPSLDDGLQTRPTSRDGLQTRPTIPDGLQTRPAAAIALFIAGTLVGGGPWYIKNAALAGNPVYPLAYGVFGGVSRTDEKNDQWNKAHQVPRDQRGWRYSPSQFAGSLSQIAGRDDLASPLVLPLLVAAGMAAICVSQFPTPQSALRTPQLALLSALAFLWILAVWWFLSHRLDRFLVPAWPFAALLTAGSLTLANLWWRRAVLVVALVGMAYCLLAASSQLVGDNRWFVALAQLRSDGPWPEATPLRIKPAHRFLNEHIQPGQAALLVGDAEPFDLEMPVYYNTCFDDALLCDWMLGKTADQRRQEFAKRQIAWVLVDRPEIARYQSPGNYGFDPRFDPQILGELVAQGVLGPPQAPVPVAPGQRPGVEVYPVLTPTTPPP